MTRIAILGGGPAGYESALVAAQLGAEVTVIDRDGIGGSCVLTDCVPSKTLIATSDRVTAFRDAPRVGISGEGAGSDIDLTVVNRRIKDLAAQQSHDIGQRLLREGVTVLAGAGRFATIQPARTHRIEVLDSAYSVVDLIDADIVLLATGGTPRVLDTAVPDGDRILSWRDVYELTSLPEHLVVIGSGVTGAEFASGYSELGVPVTLVSSRDRVLPGEDPDAAEVIERVFTSRGGTSSRQARAAAVREDGGGVVVELVDGRTVERLARADVRRFGAECRRARARATSACGSIRHGYIGVDRVSRTNVSTIYAAGDCTGVLLLASVAGMQGRIAMWHALGEAVSPLRLKTVASNVFTHPEIATVGIGYEAINSGLVPARAVTLPLATNARAKMQGFDDGFVKVYCRPATGVVIGGVVVAPNASELIFALDDGGAAQAHRGRHRCDDRGVSVTVGVGRRGRSRRTDAARRPD